MIEFNSKKYKLVRADEIQDEVAYVLVEAEEQWPKRGDEYWFTTSLESISDIWLGGSCDLNYSNSIPIFKTKEEADDYLRAQKLIIAFNNRRRELNKSRETDQEWIYAIRCAPNGTLAIFSIYEVNRTYRAMAAHPFGLFKVKSDVSLLIEEFKDDLLWYIEEYLPYIYGEGDYERVGEERRVTPLREVGTVINFRIRDKSRGFITGEVTSDDEDES